MTELSPQAQAVLDGFRAVPTLMDGPSIAGALRAAVERLGYEQELDDLSSTTLYLVDANCLLDIAAELEGAND